MLNFISAKNSLVLSRKWKKLILFPLNFPFIIIGILFVLLFRLVRPLVIVRIGIADVTKIGRIFPVDYYLSERLTEKNRRKCSTLKNELELSLLLVHFQKLAKQRAQPLALAMFCVFFGTEKGL